MALKRCTIHKKNYSRAGFTLTEIIAVFAVIGLFAAIAVPTMLHFVERGRQTNRTNIARTIYLAAQNRLTELRITKNLKAELTDEYYGPDGNYISDSALLSNKNVYTSLGEYLPAPELANGNEKYVHYISKPLGVTGPTNDVIKLLDPVIMDKSVLNNAILIEYNIRTGVVLSVFYSDAVVEKTPGEPAALDYYADNPNNDDPNNVFGTRGMGADGYAHTDARKQGYYGVEDTNTPLSAVINVYDGYERSKKGYAIYENMLYAEILISEHHLDGEFDLMINGEPVKRVPFSRFITDKATSDAIGIDRALNDSSSTSSLYRYDGNIEKGYARIIWVLDYVGGDMTGHGLESNVQHSIYKKYDEKYVLENPGKDPPFSLDENLRAGINGSVAATSFTEAHPYFFTESKSSYGGNSYTVKSARHLYNIRYVPDDSIPGAVSGDFRQMDDIDLAPVTNFAPIPRFTGRYTASYRVGSTGGRDSYAISNLTIDMTAATILSDKDNVGLFKTIDGKKHWIIEEEPQASVVGLTLENPSVRGNYNVGSVCGTLDGFITGIYVRYTTGSTKTINGVAGNVGGIVGENKGLLTDSTFVSPTNLIHVTADAGETGGLVGYNSRTLKRALFLALAPQVNGKINPIIGKDVSGTYEQLYYLSGVAKRPNNPINYNNKELISDANKATGISGLGTVDLYNTDVGSDWGKELKADGTPLDHEEETDDWTFTPKYPYPYSRFSQKQIATDPHWPVVDGVGVIGLENIAYYEKYNDNTYGLWFKGDERDYSLKSDSDSNNVIIETGYAVILEENLTSTHYFFAGADEVWNVAEDYNTEMTLSEDAGIAAAARKHDKWKDVTAIPKIWSFKLPRFYELSGLAESSTPLNIMYTLESNGTQNRQIAGYIQPLFAKGLHDKANLTELIIRTPWQMSNINVLTQANDTIYKGIDDYYRGRQFTQERNLDYEKTGIGVNVREGRATAYPSGPAVSGVFSGIYQGQGKTIEHVNITVTASGRSASLFDVNHGQNENQGRIENIRLIDSDISHSNGFAAGIAEINSGKASIAGVSLEDSAITSQNGSAAGITGTNSGTIANCKVSDDTTVSTESNSGVSGITLANTGSISGTSVENSTIRSKNGSATGIAGTNSGTIASCTVSDGTTVSTESDYGVSGVTLANTGSISSTSVAASIIRSQNGSATGIAGTNSGTIVSCTVSDGTTVSTESNSEVSGITLANENKGDITKTSVISSTVRSRNGSASGIAGTNSGRIENCEAAGVIIDGSSAVGGIARENSGSISGSAVKAIASQKSRITSENNVAGGIAGQNSGSIVKTGVQDSDIESKNYVAGGIAAVNIGGGSGSRGIIDECTVVRVAVSSLTNVGGAVGENNASADVKRTSVQSSTVSGIGTGTRCETAGGIAGTNDGEVADCMVITVDVSRGDSIGGVAGRNSGVIVKTGVEYSTVQDGGSGIGGIAGYNTDFGVARDVFFLSTNSPENKDESRPVSDYGGGIAGTNDGEIERAIYLAPAPRLDSGGKTVFYPIVGDTKSTGTVAKSFYLSGYRYSLNEGRNWTTAASKLQYNRLPLSASFEIKGGGNGLVTKFIDKGWISFVYPGDPKDWDNWIQPSTGYPYPILRNGMSLPEKWPETDSPIRPNQVDTDAWTKTLPTSNRAQNLGFVNGNFIDGDFSKLPVVEDPGGNRRLYVDMKDVSGWYTRPVNASGFSAIYQGNQNNPTPSWRLIELQEPTNATGLDMLHQYAYSNYQGNWNSSRSVRDSSYRYAELNAEVQGTLYQVCSTTPGLQFYYSFYHTSRTGGASATVSDNMNFYLTGISNDAKIVVENPAELAARDSALTMIRPCRSPRTSNANVNVTGAATKPLSDATIWNTAAWQTVAYGSVDLSYHNGRSYLQTSGSEAVQKIPPSGNAYLYDVWIGSTTGSGNTQRRTGYGITFWSTQNVTNLNTNGYSSVTSIPSSVRSDAQSNVIGYWGVEYGWKHYYGLYTVPEGQIRTEFAYQSATRNDQNGNYLDGISFKSPAFLSIDKFIKMKGGSEEVKFVKPGDELTVELHVKSWGEVKADSIVITDRLAPFDEYIEYAGNVSIKKGDTAITGSTITTPNSTNDQTLTIALPNTSANRVALNTDDELTITFNIKVRERVASDSAVETLLYYFKNQAVVEYCEDKGDNTYKLTKYADKVHKNGSGPEPVQVFIDPIKLSKTVKTIGYTSGEDLPFEDPLINGPFEVTLTIEDTLGTGNYITTTGLVSDVIPAGFTLTKTGTPPKGSTVEIIPNNDDGTTRIAIRDVGLDHDTKKIVYTYELEYTGDGYGVAYTNVSADYKYIYQSHDTDEEELNVMLKFPQPVVGITVKTAPDTYVASGTTKHLFDITENDNFADDFANDLIYRLADDNYDVKPEVILTDEKGIPVEGRKDGNYWIDGEFYTAELAKGTNNLEFTPKFGASGSYPLYYKIKLIATKTGGTPASFELSSGVEEITVFVTDTDTPVYYEKYEDGARDDSYGFYAGVSVPVPQALDNSKKIIESGYGVLSVSRDKKIQLGDGEATGDFANYGGAYIYTLNAAEVADTGWLEVKFGDADKADKLELIGKIHPNFAKSVYTVAVKSEDGEAAAEDGTETEDGTGIEDENRFAIRTPRQMWNISLLAENDKTEGVTFVQERDLDFRTLVATAGTTAAATGTTAATAGTTAAATGSAAATAGTTATPAAAPAATPLAATKPLVLEDSVVTGEFKGTFEVLESSIPYTISHVQIESEKDNIGLFSQNSGIIKGITLWPYTSIKGKNNTGGIVGHNTIDGLIEGCIVEGWKDAGDPPKYIGMHIGGYENVGGIAGLNDGKIKDCAVQNTTETIMGYNYVGGIAGLNSSSGTISGAVVSTVKLQHAGGNYGELAGENDNGSVEGTSKDVTIEQVYIAEEDGEDEGIDAFKEEAEPDEPDEPMDMKEPEEPLDMRKPEESDELDESGESAGVATPGTT